jgi:phage recombination protein Bet
MNAVVEIKSGPQLPEPVARRGINEAQWRTLANNLYPGADSTSVLMVWDYCIARKLDPLKKPCHIVPMEVKDAKTGHYAWRDVVMPGIYEYRITAHRTNLYMGHTKPEWGPLVEHLGRMVPEYCEITVFRWSPEAKEKVEFPVQIFFEEICATKKDKKTGEVGLNARWSKSPRQMLAKCTEAAALREAFPEDLGGTHTVEEMEGKQLDDIVVDASTPRIDPRGDVSQVDNDMVLDRYSTITDLLNEDKEEHEIAESLRQYEAEKLMPFPELYMVVQDKLAKEGIISKANWKKYLKIGIDRGETHTS